MGFTRRDTMKAILAAAAATIFRPKLSAAPLGTIFPRLGYYREVQIFSHDFGDNVVGRITVSRDCIAPTKEMDYRSVCGWDSNDSGVVHAHGTGQYRMRAQVRRRYSSGESFGRGVIFDSEADYLSRGPRVAEQLRDGIVKQAQELLARRNTPTGLMHRREELGDYVYS